MPRDPTGRSNGYAADKLAMKVGGRITDGVGDFRIRRLRFADSSKALGERLVTGLERRGGRYCGHILDIAITFERRPLLVGRGGHVEIDFFRDERPLTGRVGA